MLARSALSRGVHHHMTAMSSSLRRGLPRPVCASSAGKGFGGAPRTRRAEDGPSVPGQQEKRVKVVKSKGKRTMRQGLQSQEAQQRQQNGFAVVQGSDGPEDLVEQIEFEARLKSLAAKSEAQRQAAPAADPRTDIYADVQPLSRTLLPRDDSAAGKEYDSAQFGPSQAALAAAAVVLGAIFLLTSGGGDVLPTSPQLASPATSQQLSDEAAAEMEEQVADYEARADRDAGDLDALEAAAVLNAQLGRYARAEAQLARLEAGKPGDVDVLRVLAEVQSAQGRWAEAAASYAAAWEACGRGSLEVLTGLAGALVADGREAAALEAIKAAQLDGSVGIGSTELQLLAAKTYAQWRGHVPDALLVYDALIESRPDDFRPYLAKGLLLQDQGRVGDAQRYFLQARYHAREQQGLVDQIIQQRQQRQ